MNADTVFCSEGHVMTELCVEGINSADGTYECSMCSQPVTNQHLPFTCGSCDYYLCIYCCRSAQGIQWRQQNEVKSQLISKARPKKPKRPKIYLNKLLISHSPVTLVNEMKKLDSKYWYKSVQCVVGIIENAMFNKVNEAKSYDEEQKLKTMQRSINYHKLSNKLYKYSCQHNVCCSQLLNVLFLFGFRANGNIQCKDTRLSWDRIHDQSRHPSMAALYCSLKNMINENFKINNINDGDQIFYNELMESPMPFIIDRYCGITNDKVSMDISNMIHKYAFNQYKVMQCTDCFPASFIKNLQFLQDPKQFNSVVMNIGDERYLYINISPFKRSNGYIKSYKYNMY